MSQIDSQRRLFKRETLLYLSYLFCCLYLSICVLHLYIYVDVHLQLQWTLVKINVLEWATINYVKLVFVITSILSIVTNIRSHYRHRNFRVKSSIENPTTVYMIILPLLVLSLVGLTYILISNLSYVMCKITTAEIVLTFIELINLIAILLLLIDTNGITDTGELWYLNFSNFITISSSQIVLATTLVKHVVSMCLRHVFSVLNKEHRYKRSSYISCIQQNFRNDSIPFILFNITKDNVTLVNCSFIILSLTFLTYFLVSLKRNVLSLQRTLSVELEELRNTSFVGNVAKITFLEVIYAIMVGTVLVTINFLSYLSEENVHKISLQVMAMFQVGSMFALSCYIYTDVSFWLQSPRIAHPRWFDQIVLTLGTVGDLSVTVGYILTVVKDLSLGNSVGYNCFRLVVNVWTLLQIMFQSLIAFFIINRRFHSAPKWQIKKIYKRMNPILILSIMNATFLLCNGISPGTVGPWNYHQSRAFFMKGVMILCYPLCLVNRIFCICVFVRMMR